MQLSRKGREFSVNSEVSMVRKRVRVQIRRIPGNSDIHLPEYMSEGAVALDLAAAVPTTVILHPGSIAMLPTGLAVAIPSGYEGQIRGRSGIAVSQGLVVANAPATIDSDYRGEVKIAVINLGKIPVEITRGMRIAQFVVVPVPQIVWKEVAELPPTERGEQGFGHTGL